MSPGKQGLVGFVMFAICIYTFAYVACEHITDWWSVPTMIIAAMFAIAGWNMVAEAKEKLKQEDNN